MSKIKSSIDVVVPMLNERENLISIVEHISTILLDSFREITFILVDDGSTDGTEEAVLELKKFTDKVKIKYLKLAKNYGQDLAIKSGVDHSTSDICAMIDADFQHPPEKIIEAAKYLEQGYSIVHILKKEHNFGPRYRRIGSRLFNQLVNFLSGVEIHLTDYKVLDRKAVQKVREFREGFYFSRGIIDLIGLKATSIEYEPRDRKHGQSNYSFTKLLKLAVNSIISASVKPLRLSIYFGLIISFFSFLYALFIIFEKLLLGQPIPGFPTLATAMFFLGGIQLLFLGILGEYLGKTFIESKNRPQYLVDYIKDI